MIWLVLLGLDIFVLVGLTEYDLGVVAFVPLMLAAVWLMEKIFKEEQ